MVKRKSTGVKSEVQSTITTAIAGKGGATAGRGRKGRDRITRVGRPIKGVDTQARQWNRYSP